MAKFTLTIELEVSQSWIEDGCNPHAPAWKESIEEAVSGLLPYAFANEVKATIKKVSGTSNEECLKMQGY